MDLTPLETEAIIKVVIVKLKALSDMEEALQDENKKHSRTFNFGDMDVY